MASAATVIGIASSVIMWLGMLKIVIAGFYAKHGLICPENGKKHVQILEDVGHTYIMEDHF